MNFLFERKTRESLDLPTGRNWNLPDRQHSMRMKWHDLLFLNWPVEPDEIRDKIPESLEIDLFDSKAWISVVPFKMSGVAPRWFPELPWVSSFPELNVRTYVIRDGKPGVWFFSLDATNPIAVRVARRWFYLNYVDARIDVSTSDNWINYRCYRIDRGSTPAELSVDYRPIGETFHAPEGSLDDWLTSRFCLYTAGRRGEIYRGEIDHPPWELRETQAVVHANSMLESIGISTTTDALRPLFAKRTDVLAWSLEKVV